MNEANLIGAVAHRKPLVSNKNLKARFEFEKPHLPKSMSFWKNILWGDESKFNRFGSDSKVHVWLLFCVSVDKHKIHTKGSETWRWQYHMCMGNIFSWHGAKPISKIDTKMNQHINKDILENRMEPFADENLPLEWKFMHYNDPKYTLRLVKKWFDYRFIDVLKWHAKSPDFNRNENVWYDVEKNVKFKKSRNFKELWYAVKEGWYSTPTARFQVLVESLPRRLEVFIKQKGYPT